MQKWEYAWIKQMRGYGGTLFGGTADKWNFDTGTMSSNIMKYYAEKRNIFDIANMMGDDGWELINMVPQSGIGGTASSGFTSDLVWV
ncbi:MAG TPA: hypothetical protein VF276_11005, partial [Chloroflexia bacterium]